MVGFSLELSLTECGAEKNSDRDLVFCPGKLPQQKEMHSQYRIAVGLFTVNFMSSIICPSGTFKDINWVGRDVSGSPVVKTSPSSAGGVTSIPGQRAKITPALWPINQNRRQKRYCNKFNKGFKNGAHQKTTHLKKRNKINVCMVNWIDSHWETLMEFTGLIFGSGRSPGEGNGNPLQHSFLENPMESGAWRAKVLGVA